MVQEEGIHSPEEEHVGSIAAAAGCGKQVGSMEAEPCAVAVAAANHTAAAVGVGDGLHCRVSDHEFLQRYTHY